jgi:mannan endo-1,4-beta-mannosidase
MRARRFGVPMSFRALISTLVLAGALAVLPAPARADFEHFISVDGARLMDGDREFRFVSFNVPTLLFVEDEMAFAQTNPYGLPSEYELRDLYATVAAMGGRVVRAYTIPVRNRRFPANAVTYVEGPGEFNEDAFRVMDLALALAREYGIRVIVPLVNNWQWMGGRPNYAEFRGRDAGAFWTDPQLIADFEATIAYVLNRRNTITGIRYRDDKTILGWETGNELQNPPDWALEIGRYIKSIDRRHLLLDGNHGAAPQYALDAPEFDVIDVHHYETSPVEMLHNLQRTVDRVAGRKPVLLGEFGFISTSGFEAVLDYVIGEPRIPGALIWSLRRHDGNGGFFQHSEPVGHGLYRAYHWPGFDDGEPYDERNLLHLVRAKAFEIQGREAPPIAVPQPPELLPFEEAPMFSWRGSMGAAAYTIERSDARDGPWLTIAGGIDDCGTPGFPLFSDAGAKVGGTYFYRVRAGNAAGESAPSNLVGPVRVAHLTRVDAARNLAVLLDSKGVEVRTGEYRSYKEAYARLHGEQGAYLVYTAPGRLLGLRIYAYEADAEPGLALLWSADGSHWQAIPAQVEHYASSEKNYDYLVPVRYEYAAAAARPGYFRADFSDAADIVRVEIDYR